MSKNEKEKAPSMVNKKQSRKEKYNQMVYDNWQANREMGKLKFVIKFGVLSWGIGTYVIYWFLMMVLNAITKANAEFSLYQYGFTLIFFIIFGLIYGTILWHKNEKVFTAKFPYGRKTQTQFNRSKG
ncbi:hypothetical protein [Fusibacter sp. 3D3]|uniref:hypothetical protein n=1 Tax=Fusibacter sp. 3D3 TaxID=1048380 RepID=UPI0008529006|nr:hypothetical protein [Fusibacter sp. 3D3]GAU78991.1 hypothetical protein F3D3_3627 [Fusibacter sp. 3D3]